MKSSFVARKKAALFSLENIKVIVRSDEALVFSPFQKDAQDFIQYLQKDIQSGDDNKDKDNLINPSSRFELAVIEAGGFIWTYFSLNSSNLIICSSGLIQILSFYL